MANDKDEKFGQILAHTGWPDGAVHTPEGEEDRRDAEGTEPPAIPTGSSSVSTDQYYEQKGKAWQ
ncbi:MAG TPA: hypothetical protein PKZ16_00985 [bacterium]|nr:hypothetical protein [bacterium]HPL95458.1 hypothetical protein [bacterium]